MFSQIQAHARPLDWKHVARLALTSRALDALEEARLVPEGKVAYQFSARGHELAQVVLGQFLDHRHDGVAVYYRSRALMLALGLDVEDALAASLGRAGGMTNGRDIGVVFNLPARGGPTVLPMTGDVGGQFTQAAGWAQAIRHHREVMGDTSWDGAIAVACAGDGAVATGGFWSAVNLATTLLLPLLLVIEDNGWALSTPAGLQTPGGNIARNLAGFPGFLVLDGDGAEPSVAADLIRTAVAHVRREGRPCLLRLAVPRLAGHSVQDTQAYRTAAELAAECGRDPLPRLRELVSGWSALEAAARDDVDAACARALRRGEPRPGAGGVFAATTPRRESDPIVDGARINMSAAITRTLAHELTHDRRVVVFGEDVAVKGGVHGVTRGLASQFGARRVYDTSLSEEGIIGRAVGMALAGMRPVAELQFRKYAHAAAEQLANCGTVRWRTAGRFAAPVVVRIAGGFGRTGDPWHSMTDETSLLRNLGWRVFVPSNAADAAGLLRAALRGQDPTIFFEHRWLLDAPSARRPYPGDDWICPPGRARVVHPGNDLTIVTWGAMVERCERAQAELDASIEILDLRTLAPWDHEAVVASVRRTRRCLVVHEEARTAGFGAEIAATVASDCLFELEAPVERVASLDLPLAYNAGLLAATVPDVTEIAERAAALLRF